jgi:hypothetical protein
MNATFQTIQQLAPKAWADLLKFYKEEVADKSNLSIPLEALPFELSMGILYRYFHENAVEWDVSNIPYNELPESLIDVFDQYEKVITHYS